MHCQVDVVKNPQYRTHMRYPQYHTQRLYIGVSHLKDRILTLLFAEDMNTLASFH